MDDDEGFVYDDDLAVSHRWSWFVFIVRVVETIANVFHALASGLNEIANLVAAHHNFDIDNRNFADEIREEIESIPTQED